MDQPDRLTRWVLRVWLAIGALTLLTAAWWVLREPLGLVVPPIAIAAVLVYVLNPAVGRLADHGLPRPVATFVAYLVAGGLLYGGLALVGPLLVAQAGELVDNLPDIGLAVEQTVNRGLTRIGIPAASQLDLETAGIAESVRGWLATNRDQLLELVRGAGSVVGWVVHLALALTLGPILAFYTLADLPRLTVGIGRLLPPDQRGEVVEVGARIGRIVGSYFRGQLLVATFVGVATAFGLWAIGLPFWAVVGITTGLFNLVPLIGPTTGAIIGVLLALTVGGGVQQAVLVVLVMVAVQQVDNHLITPLVVGRSVSVHPITVIVALVVAGSLGGIPLMFVAIPAVATLKLVLLHLAVTRLPSMAHLAAEFEDGTAAPKGTVADLAQDLRQAFDTRIERAEASARRRWAESRGDAPADEGDDDAVDAPTADGVADRDVSPPAGVARPS